MPRYGSQSSLVRRRPLTLVGDRALLLSGAAAVLGLAVTVATATGVWTFEYRSVTAHIVLDTTASCIALLVGYLFYGRMLRRRRTQDFLLLQGLVLLGSAEVGPLLVKLWVDGAQAGTVDVWLPLATRVAGLAFLMVAALTLPSRRLRSGGITWGVAPSLLVLAVLVVAIGSSWDRLPVALPPALAPDAAEAFTAGHPLLVTGFAFSVLCFGIAAVAFTWQGRRNHDEMVIWVGAACTLATFSRVNYLLFPSLYSHWVYAGDVLRVGFYVLLLAGAAREIREHWSAQVQAAVAEDRRRLARELHDGVLQELAYIRHQSSVLRDVDAELTSRLSHACDRAMDEARQAVETLGSQAEEPLGFALHRAVSQVAARFDLKLEIDIDDSVAASPDQRHALLRIAREAVSNAARHGRAHQVFVRLASAGTGERLLSVRDDGTGFDVDQQRGRAGGFGLVSMRERAEALPGALTLASAADEGTVVEVRW